MLNYTPSCGLLLIRAYHLDSCLTGKLDGLKTKGVHSIGKLV